MIFSLTNKDVFTINNSIYSIYNQGGAHYGPTYGYPFDLVINGQGGQITLNSSYINTNYKQNDKDSFLKMTGNPNNSGAFKIT